MNTIWFSKYDAYHMQLVDLLTKENGYNYDMLNVTEKNLSPIGISIYYDAPKNFEFLLQVYKSMPIEQSLKRQNLSHSPVSLIELAAQSENMLYMRVLEIENPQERHLKMIRGTHSGNNWKKYRMIKSMMKFK